MRRLTVDYLKTEQGSGLVLAVAAAAALGLANSRIDAGYFALLARPIPLQVGDFAETLSLAGWVRALLMPILFLVLGMELKFELLRGELSSLRRLTLPAAAAAGGVVLPVALGLALGRGAGWSAGAATDGAAALATLALMGPRLPQSLRVVVMTVAVTDNLIAVLAAGILTAERLDLAMLTGAAVVVAGLALLSRWRRAPFLFYAAGFVLVWAFWLKSGLDPALAGVACAFAVPIGARRAGQESTLKFFMESLHGYVAFVILPLFVLTAADVRFRDMRLTDLATPQALAVMLALVVGKPLGVWGFSAVAVTLKLARRPTGANWIEMLGVALLCGIGFTMSYFMAGVAGARPSDAVRAAILIASVVSAVGGGWVLSWAQAQRAVAGAEALA
jgi:NhaA family Na+:H+ antiporter